jgi:hypothetical protein
LFLFDFFRDVRRTRQLAEESNRFHRQMHGHLTRLLCEPARSGVPVLVILSFGADAMATFAVQLPAVADSAAGVKTVSRKFSAVLPGGATVSGSLDGNAAGTLSDPSFTAPLGSTVTGINVTSVGDNGQTNQATFPDQKLVDNRLPTASAAPALVVTALDASDTPAPSGSASASSTASSAAS